jgi:hypothetical protein
MYLNRFAIRLCLPAFAAGTLYAVTIIFFSQAGPSRTLQTPNILSHTPIDFMGDAERCLIDGGMFGKRFRALRSLNVFVLFLHRILRRGLASA